MALNSTGIDSGSMSSATKSKTYATIAADLDLVALGSANCRRIRVGTAGNLNVDYGGGTTDIIPFLAGESQDIQAAKILATSTTAAQVTIYW